MIIRGTHIGHINVKFVSSVCVLALLCVISFVQ